MNLAIIKLQEELDYETHLLERGFYKNKTEFDSDGTEQDCKKRIESYKKAIKTITLVCDKSVLDVLELSKNHLNLAYKEVSLSSGVKEWFKESSKKVESVLKNISNDQD